MATLLPTGPCAETVQRPGFNRSVVKGTILQVNRTVRIDIQLHVGQLTESTQVTAEVPLMITERSDVSETIESTHLTHIPLNSRSYLQWALLTPGASRMARANGNIG